MKACIFGLLAIALLLSSSCHKTPPCDPQVYAETIDSAKGPDTGSINGSLNFILTYTIEGCEQYTGVNEMITGNTYLIRVFVTIPRCDEACPAIVGIRKTTYTFTPPSTGTYYLKFSQSGNQYITDTVVIK